jgi:hypothetical protein
MDNPSAANTLASSCHAWRLVKMPPPPKEQYPILQKKNEAYQKKPDNQIHIPKKINNPANILFSSKKLQ